MSVAPGRRWTRTAVCTICGGCDRDPRGQGKRCTGFLSEDGEYVHCSREELAGAIPLSPGSETYGHRLHGPCKCGVTHGEPVMPPTSYTANGNGHHKGAPMHEKQVAIYDYRAADGTLAHQTIRYEPKRFTQRRPDGNGGWIYTLDIGRPGGIVPVLYRLPELLASPPDEPIFIVEGERDVETLRALGLVATCNVGGTGMGWQPSYNAALVDRDVVIIPDVDPPEKQEKGQRHAQKVQAAVRAVARKASLLALPAHDVTDWVADGGTAAALRRLAHDVLHPPPPIRILTGAELRALPRLDFLYQDIIPERAFFAVIGESHSGKTFFMVDMLCRLARAGHQVLYIVGEGQRGISMRYIAWCQHYNGGKDVENIYFIPEPIVPTLDDMIANLKISMASVGCPMPALILFDTLAMCFIGNDNGSEEMSAFCRAVKDLGFACESATGVVHHTGWEGTRMAGNRKLQNAVDVEMFVSQEPESGIISVKCTKMRDGERFTTRTFKLERVPGSGSCVVVGTLDQPTISGVRPRQQQQVLIAAQAAGSAGLSYSALHRASGISGKRAFTDALTALITAHEMGFRGEQGSRDRRYVHADFILSESVPNPPKRDQAWDRFPLETGTDLGPIPRGNISSVSGEESFDSTSIGPNGPRTVPSTVDIGPNGPSPYRLGPLGPISQGPPAVGPIKCPSCGCYQPMLSNYLPREPICSRCKARWPVIPTEPIPEEGV